MNILLLAGSPSLSSRSTRLLHHVGEKLLICKRHRLIYCGKNLAFFGKNLGFRVALPRGRLYMFFF